MSSILVLRLKIVQVFLIPLIHVTVSDGRGDGRKFDKGPSRHHAKHVPGRVPELEKTLGAVYQ